MAYLVRLSVRTWGDTSLEDRIAVAIRKSGGVVRRSTCTGTTPGATGQDLAIVIDETRMIPRIVRAVETVRGAAVTAVTEPQELGTLRRI